MTLWELAGGEAAVKGVLSELYDRLFSDPMVGFMFDGASKERIIDNQLRFVASFLGGPYVYEGLSMPEAHARLPLLPGHFDRRHHLLKQILLEYALPEPVIAEWLRVDEALRQPILKCAEDARLRARTSH